MKMNQANTEHEIYGWILHNVGSIWRFWRWFINRQLESAT